MYLTEVSIKRPVVAWVMSLILIIFGIFVFLELPVRELPDGIQPPVVQVQTDYKSASAEIVDEEITQKLEDVIGGAEGIKNIEVYNLLGQKLIEEKAVGSLNTSAFSKGSYLLKLLGENGSVSSVRFIKEW